jgi:hypothetical protein
VFQLIVSVGVEHDSDPVPGDGWLFPHPMGVLSKGKRGEVLYIKSLVSQDPPPNIQIRPCGGQGNVSNKCECWSSVHDPDPVPGDGWLFPHPMGVLSKGKTGKVYYIKSLVAQGPLPIQM